jgi:dUTP pyrophosphatase
MSKPKRPRHPLSTTVKFKKLQEDVRLPEAQSGGAAGLDIRAHLPLPLYPQGVEIKSGGRAIIPTGFAMQLELGYEAVIRPRSGMAIKRGITVINTPGTIDCDYRGEVKVGLVNLSGEDVIIANGERVAQMVIQAVPRVQLQEVEELDDTDRGEGGLGSTGSS